MQATNYGDELSDEMKDIATRAPWANGQHYLFGDES